MLIGICDDEISVLVTMRRMVKDYCGRNAVKAEIRLFASGAELAAQAEDLDLLFLDIEMPGLDGIAAGKILRKKNPHCKIVMVTCRDDRMREAFQLEACRFLSKPFDEEAFAEAMEGFEQSMAGCEKIELWEMRQLVRVRQREIIYVQTFDSYTEFIVGNRLMRSEKSLSALEEELDPKLFFRVNKKYIVNFRYIDSYGKGELTIREKTLIVSRRRKKEFERRYRNLICISGNGTGPGDAREDWKQKKRRKKIMLENLILLAVYVIEAVKYCLGVYIVFHEKVERKWLYGVGGMVMVLYLFGIQPEVEKNSLVIFILIICLTLANVSGKIREKITKSLLLIVLVVNIDATVSTLTDQISNHIWKMKNSQIFLDCLWGIYCLDCNVGI